MSARVIVLAGPSGSGKSRLSGRVGLPVLRLDDYYKEGDDPSLPCVDLSGGDPIVDWDHPDSWDHDHAVAAIESLCRTGSVLAPSYDISASSRTGTHPVDLGESRFFIAEGIFAQHVIAECRSRGLLAEAICVTQHPVVTAMRRFTRDLSEHRKPPWVLVRRGLLLMRRQRRIVAEAEALGARVMSPQAAEELIRDLVAG